MIILHVDRVEPGDILISGLKSQDVGYFHVRTIYEAFETLKIEHIDLILVGEQLDGNTGLDLIRRLSETSFDSIPIVYINEDDETFSSGHNFSLGVVDNIKRSELTTEEISKFLCYIYDQSLLVSELQTLSIAVVDDCDVTHGLVKSILQSKGIYDITYFTDPLKLIENKREFDVYLIDMIMPGITGDKLAVKLRMRSYQSIIIIMSTIDNVKTISSVLSSGADDYIIKPFNKDILLARLKTNFRSFKLVSRLENNNKIDVVTGAYNHGFIYNKLHEEINSAAFKKSDLTILLLDIDNFKEINENLGHNGEDNVLTILAKTFKDSCRRTDYFGRYGVEQFIFIMTHTNLSQAQVFTNRLKDLFSEKIIEGIGKKVTFSGGLVQWSKGVTGEDLVKSADDLLYESKREGMNKITY